MILLGILERHSHTSPPDGSMNLQEILLGFLAMHPHLCPPDGSLSLYVILLRMPPMYCHICPPHGSFFAPSGIIGDALQWFLWFVLGM